MTTYTTKEYANVLKNATRLETKVALKLAVDSLVDEYYDRIFIKHKKTDGGKIQYVSKNPVYINSIDGSPQALDPIGKTGKSVFASTGEDHKSTYFSSYKKFKAKIGRPILELFGELKSAFANGTKKLNDDTYVIAIPKKEYDKMDGLEHGNGKWSGFGEITKFTEKEKKLFFDTYKFELKRQLNAKGIN